MDGSDNGNTDDRCVREFKLVRAAASVGALSAHLATWLPVLGVPDATMHAVHVCCDEVIANACQHSGETAGPILLRAKVEGRHLLLGFRYRAHPFDPAARRHPDLHTPVSLRDIGGLGLHLLQALCNDCHYEFDDDHHHLSLAWRWPP